MGHETPHCEGFGRIPPQGGLQSDIESASVRTGWIMSLSSTGKCDGGGGTSGGGDISLLLTENSRTVAQSIYTKPIMDLCLAAERSMGLRVDKRWWYQDGLDLEGMWTAAW